jgi:hypothetical protein
MPFTARQFFEIFEKYNEFVFPLQAVLIPAAAACVFLVFGKNKVFDRIIAAFLAILWLWAGIVYHLLFFTQINPVAYVFGALFVFEGALFFYLGVVKERLRFGLENNFSGRLGVIFIAYALIVYPVISSLLGHGFPFSPTFGAPCPTAIFTFGLLMLTDRRLPLYVLIIPFLWAGLGAIAALSFGIYEDFGLPASAVGATFFVLRRYFARQRRFNYEKKFI